MAVGDVNSFYIYAAGILDGEGCIFITKSTWKNKRPWYALGVNIWMCNAEVIQKMQQVFGGSVRCHLPKNRKHVVWRWYIAGREAEAFLKKVYPFLIVKKAEAEIALEFMSRKRRYWKGHFRSPEQIAFEEQMKNKLSNLKIKGR